MEIVYFGHLHSDDGAMHHSGDNRSGQGDGDDETIKFDLGKISPNAAFLCFTINSYSGEPLNTVENARCRIYNSGTGQEHASFTLTHDKLMPPLKTCTVAV